VQVRIETRITDQRLRPKSGLNSTQLKIYRQERKLLIKEAQKTTNRQKGGEKPLLFSPRPHKGDMER
jgi:hypothetical protein